MRLKTTFLALLLSLSISLQAQTYNEYEMSFDNAVHHEAQVKIKFSNLENKVLEVRMSRSSPGRYAVSAEADDAAALRGAPIRMTLLNAEGRVAFETITQIK